VQKKEKNKKNLEKLEIINNHCFIAKEKVKKIKGDLKVVQEWDAVDINYFL
jgi:hypothetical protein